MCFEHPGLLAPVDDCARRGLHHLLRRRAASPRWWRGRRPHAVVRDPRGTEPPSTRCWWARSLPGDLVLLHAGTAIARVDAVTRRRREALTWPRAPTSCIRSSRATSATRARSSPISRRRWRPRSRPGTRCARLRSPGSGPRSPRPAALRWRTASPRAAGSSRSATAGAPPTPARSRRCSRRPPAGRPLPARCLADDPAVLTALANDVGFELVFSRQLIAHAGPDDIALGISTSGNSRNLLAAFAEAARRGLLTLGLAGYDGGDMAGVRRRRRTASSSSPTACTASRRCRRRSAWRLWSEVQARLDEDATGG